MRVVLDTNVLVSGMFWPGGPPRKIIQAWLAGGFSPLVSSEIVEEYTTVVKRISQKRGLDVSRLLERLLMRVDFVLPSPLPKQICSDTGDDKFIAAALSGRANFIVTGDRALLSVRQFRKVKVMTANAFARMVERTPTTRPKNSLL